MTSRITEIIVDSRDPQTLAKWWAEVLDYHAAAPAPQGWVAISAWPVEADRPDDDAYRLRAQVPSVVFVPVPEPKSGKNRVHWDVWSVDRTQAEEVAWLLERGARRVDVGQRDVTWVVMADPEGNEFCVLG
ncbi:MAG TPA: VOC family protein [Candidatus Dormibacteraeota bacterium]|nr:VOC family protein [Candidatus Dormibacteraeota bacterium]